MAGRKGDRRHSGQKAGLGVHASAGTNPGVLWTCSIASSERRDDEPKTLLERRPFAIFCVKRPRREPVYLRQHCIQPLHVPIFQRRQIVHARQAKMLEEQIGDPIEDRAARVIEAARFFQ